MKTDRKLPPVLGLLYTHNPFYLLSTCFVLYAIKRAFQPGVAEYLNPWALMASLTGFTLLAAVTAWVVVRFGKVWEDARSILLVLVLMFLAISVSFDELLNLFSTQVAGLLAFGFAFSVLVTEAILLGLRIRFPAAFRVPFYLILALFFAYPVFVSPEVTGLSPTETRWRIASFPACAGAISLLLLFAIRRGADFVADNGTPWRWPWFPWTLFLFLAAAVCARSYSLSISFDTSVGLLTEMNSAFGGYFLVPFLLAVMVLLLEIGVVEGKRRLCNGVMIAAGLLVLLAAPIRTSDPTHAEFLATFTTTLASPVFLTVLALLAFYLYSWLRGVRLAEAGIAAMLLICTVIGPATAGLDTLTEPQLWPLAVLGGMQLVLALHNHSSVRGVAASVCFAGMLTLMEWPPELREFRGLISAHALFLAMAVIGLVFRDGFARLLTALSAAVLPILCLVTALVLFRAGIVEAVIVAYVAGMTALAAVCWYFTGNRWYLAAAFSIVAGGSGGAAWLAVQDLSRRLRPEVSQPLLYGGVCFLIAALISAHKAGVFGGGKLRRSETGGPG
jgi:hypothetical protein